MDKTYYYNKLYPLQDKVLKIITGLNTGFYLTGGTASSRAYLHHRFSDDLDFFVNDDENFTLWTDRIINILVNSSDWKIEILLKDIRFVRFSLIQEDMLLKIELVNDVPSHIGSIVKHDILGKVDNSENILANKITALVDREEPKDLADIWGFCCKMGLSIIPAITNANSKAAGIFPADLARIICSVNEFDWQIINWIDPPEREEYISRLQELGESLIILQ